MNKHRNDFHNWIINEWKRNDFSRVIYLKEYSSRWYIRLWEHKCGKWYEVGDIVVR
jgi:hypothetical protein